MTIEFNTVNKKMLKVCRQIEKAAQTDVSVLILGERGVGKAACARQIHLSSTRAALPFVEIGAEEANQHSILHFVAKAEAGTLYIDEIATLATTQQHILQDILSDSASSPMPRLIASSTPPLESLVKQKLFLEELYYSLGVTKIRLLPLRERREDIPLLIQDFMRACVQEYSTEKTIDPAVVELLVARSWPGNIYELQSLIQYAFQRAQGEIREADLPTWSTSVDYTSNTGESLHDELCRIAGELVQSAQQVESYNALDDYKRLVLPPLIIAALEQTNGNISTTAKLLGLTRNTLKKIIREYNIEKKL
jgi:two-component system nitrogen regulation response regulator GlnG